MGGAETRHYDGSVGETQRPQRSRYSRTSARVLALPSTAKPASALETSVESVSQARSSREDRCYQDVVRWDVRVNLPMSPSSVYVLPPVAALCGGTRLNSEPYQQMATRSELRSVEAK